jgi:hypothetical protein
MTSTGVNLKDFIAGKTAAKVAAIISIIDNLIIKL